MKKIIGYSLSVICFNIGNIMYKISAIKKNNEFVFDNHKYVRVGLFLAEQYQRFMQYSYNIQMWANIESPWRKSESK